MTDDEQDIYDPDYVKGVFDRCSEKYIAFSYVCSMGFTERWRRQCVGAMPEPPTGTPRGYDLMSGAGEVWPHFMRSFPDTDSIIAIDISEGMHKRALERLHRHRHYSVDFIENNVLSSTVPDESADFIISTFGLKTFNEAQHETLAKLVARVLKPGGVFSMIEASDPEGWAFRPFYLFYLKRVLPMIERFFLQGAQDFSMIGAYCMNFGDASGFADMLRREGLYTEYRKYFFGCATGVSGRKPL